MSQANLEIVKRAIDAMNQRVDTNQRAELFAELMTPDFEWLPAMPGAVEGVSYRGREAVETYFDESAEIWEEFHTVIDEFRDLGDRVLTFGHMGGRGAGSGLPDRHTVGAGHRFSRRQDFARSQLSRSRQGVADGGSFRVGGEVPVSGDAWFSAKAVAAADALSAVGKDDKQCCVSAPPQAPAGRQEPACPSAEYVAELPSQSTNLSGEQLAHQVRLEVAGVRPLDRLQRVRAEKHDVRSRRTAASRSAAP